MKYISVILTGFGNVGHSLVNILNSKKNVIAGQYKLDIRITAVIGSRYAIIEEQGIDLQRLSNCDKHSKGIQQYGKCLYEIVNSKDLLEKLEADVLIEASPTNIETGEPGFSHIYTAISKGMDVVVLSKGALVQHSKEIQEFAHLKGARVKMSGATAAALPTIDLAQYNLAGNDIYKIQGILNGTTNYILTRMHKKNISFTEALQEAQEEGIAEANPKLDIGGFDTASKLLILANTIWGTSLRLKDVALEGIENITREDVAAAVRDDKTIKLVGEAVRESYGVRLRVVPIVLENSNILTRADYKDKAVVFYTDLMGTMAVVGGASDPKAAAAAALKDVINLFR
ncbi:homoserine dehydrogenase [Geosporobacter ferrireducens]|uniref:Homoserine dehydrogenase n=2 Tax=Geosporobacter ferrireducens TaxID=1424294 RepID=A0A1D8GCE2_9FIRM|nr:homoserine dehydrogenase [Geosporobacter ferrireducens]AOT68583.1 hypothetical protein Gferi_02615 [Geosporobacter ferrireducens]